MGWLHISDIHTGGKNLSRAKQMLKSTVNLVKRLVEEKGEKIDAIFITGDVAFSGERSDYGVFYDEFIVPISGIIGDGYENSIFIVPGNHDVERRVNKRYDRKDVLNDESFWVNNEAGKVERQDVAKRFSGFEYMYHGIFGGESWIDSESSALKRDVIIDGVKCSVVHINTAMLAKDDHDEGNLGVSIDGVVSVLDECDGRVVVIGHHPLGWLSVDRAKRLEAEFARRKVLYLHGHMHEVNATIKMYGVDRYIRLGAGAVSSADDENRISLGKFSDGDVEFEYFVWKSDRGEWRHDSASIEGSFYDVDKKVGRICYASGGGADKRMKLPSGWYRVTQDFIRLERERCNEAKVIGYFDGAHPDFSVVSSRDIPRRNIVGRIKDYIDGGNREMLLLVDGGGGRG